MAFAAAAAAASKQRNSVLGGVGWLTHKLCPVAQMLISPSHYLINWVTNQTWRVPEAPGAIRTQPYILPHEVPNLSAPSPVAPS